MTITELQHQYAGHPNVEALNKLLGEPAVRHIYCGGLYASAASLFASALVEKSPCPFVFILGDLEEAGYFYHDLTQVLGTERILFFPSSFRRSVKYGQKDAANEILRTEVLSRLQKGEEGLCIVTYPDALAEKVVSRQELSENTLKLHVGERVDTGFITDVLHSYGFEYVDYVYEPGQYAVRGSIIDVFSFSSEYPYRIDFFGNDVESIRTFEVDSQLSKEKKESIVIVPDLAVTGKVTTSFLDFIPKDTTLAMRDFLWLRERIQDVHDESLTPQALASQEAEENGGITLEGKLIDGSEFTVRALDFRRMEFGNKPTGTPDATLTFHTTAQPIFHKNFDLVAESFKEYLNRGYALYICSDSTKQTDRIKAIFEDRGDDIPFTSVNKTIHEGFADETLRVCLFTDHQLFDRFHKFNLKSDKARSGKLSLSLKELNQFTTGDYIVHIDHGVGQFGGLVRTEVNGKMQEAIRLIYQNNDIIFVSIHSLHKLSKYKGKDSGEPPKLSKLGTGAWEKMKERTKSKVKDIARDLILLYSKRKQEKGFAYSPDSFMQHELEASFIYEDTPDQMKATADVKADMENDRPMDRLICGDVGFGKTEVAIRAAFKAVSDNKQVAVLVPTTVLAFQHYQTFSERLKDFPCRIEYISRARTAKEIRETLKDLKEGNINIIIGTHRIVGKDVTFKDLGLLIIDEEQKFGVAAKEKLTQMSVNVDTLTLTATPIPRTLQFSLMGSRDLSVISTPPPNRQPIITESHLFSEEIIRDAVNAELDRGGQVYFVHNRVEDLMTLQGMVTRLCPRARVGIGHGKMPAEQLEKLIMDFIYGEFDVLISTTIVENGIDIPNANTIIVNNAQNFGLSDLHQLRGRVGRGSQRGYCYLLSPGDELLTPDARRRLRAIEEFSDLGSGFNIAMQDLDIRGAGNLLGAEQSGFIADIGFETYQKIMQEAIAELRSEGLEMPGMSDAEQGVVDKMSYISDSVIEIDVEAELPDSYVQQPAEKLRLYRELDTARNEEMLKSFEAKMIDRFGPLPRPAAELLNVVRLRWEAVRLGMERVKVKNGLMIVHFVGDDDSPYYKSDTFMELLRKVTQRPDRFVLKQHNNRLAMTVRGIKDVAAGYEVLKSL